VAHVLNLDHSRVNTEMVDIEPLAGEDAVELRSIVERHYAETGSTVAEAILADWPRYSAEFSTIMPRDYKRVLQASRTAELSGRDVDDAIMEAARG
jgi:glutamate synthase domain-containing protein 3